MYETGEHAGRLLLDMLAGRARYAVCWHRLPLMSHTLRSTTLDGPMLDAVNAARALEAEGLPAVSVFGGFSLADIAAPCVSVVATCRTEERQVATTLTQGAAMSASEKPPNTETAGRPSASRARAAFTASSMGPSSVVLRSVWLISGSRCQHTA